MHLCNAWTSAALATLGLLLTGCAPEVDHGEMTVEVVRTSLITEPGSWAVLAEPSGHPVELMTLVPWTSSRGLGVVAPSLRLVPDTRVRLETGGASGTVLRMRSGFDRGAYQGEDIGRVRFRVRAGDRVVHESVRPYGRAVPQAEREWVETEHPIPGSGVLVLETHLLESTGAPPAFGVSGLEVVERERVVRRGADEDHPNVVLVVMDTLRADRLGCYGYERPLSPNIDALAERGAVFERGFSAAPWTWPSTASILTGLEPPAHGVVDQQSCFLSYGLDTLTESLQRAGWTTGAFSTNPLISAETDFDQGFEEFHGFDLQPTREIRDEIEDWIAAQGERRFFLYLQLVDPHEYLPDEQYLERWGRPAPEDFEPAVWIALERARTAELDRFRLRIPDYVDYYSAVYDATVAEADAFMGALTRALERSGVAEHTVVALTSDHGEEFYEHGQVLHAKQLYDESVHVPLILAGPGVPAGVRYDLPVENRHLAATLLSLAGVPDDHDVPGLDLLDGRDRDEARTLPVFCSTELGRWIARDGALVRTPASLHSVRFQGLLYLWNPEPPEGDTGDRLFDLDADPGAQVDLSDARPEDCRKLRTLIVDWIERGAAHRPASVSGGRSSLELLERLGYVDSEQR